MIENPVASVIAAASSCSCNMYQRLKSENFPKSHINYTSLYFIFHVLCKPNSKDELPLRFFGYVVLQKMVLFLAPFQD